MKIYLSIHKDDYNNLTSSYLSYKEKIKTFLHHTILKDFLLECDISISRVSYLKHDYVANARKRSTNIEVILLYIVILNMTEEQKSFFHMKFKPDGIDNSFMVNAEGQKIV